MQWIDLKEVLGRTVSDLYGDLVTRRTGQAVRTGIEEMLGDLEGEVAVIDFGTVRCLDISCADEIVGKLLLQHVGRYFLLVGVDEGHREAIEPVLERHQLAAVAHDRAGTVQLLGSVPDPVRRAFGVLVTEGGAEVGQVAERLALTTDAARAAVDELRERHLVRESDGGYHPLCCA
jgi:hypothetical protein